MKCFLRLNDLFSQGSRQGTLMPGLLNFLYEQLSYPKILPFVCKLSIEISLRRAILVKRVLRLLAPPHAEFHRRGKSIPSAAGEPAAPVR